MREQGVGSPARKFYEQMMQVRRLMRRDRWAYRDDAHARVVWHIDCVMHRAFH